MWELGEALGFLLVLTGCQSQCLDVQCQVNDGEGQGAMRTLRGHPVKHEDSEKAPWRWEIYVSEKLSFRLLVVLG
jgi:hypothetical protein